MTRSDVLRLKRVVDECLEVGDENGGEGGAGVGTGLPISIMIYTAGAPVIIGDNNTICEEPGRGARRRRAARLADGET
jgi:hypothetical protein